MICGTERTEDVEALAEKVARKQCAEEHRKRAERRNERRGRKRICREVQHLADCHCTEGHIVILILIKYKFELTLDLLNEKQISKSRQTDLY